MTISFSGTTFRRHLQHSMRAASSFANSIPDVVMEEELLNRFPTLQPNRRAPTPRAPRTPPASTQSRPRRIARANVDRRRNLCLRIRMTALDSPSITSSATLNFDRLRSKGLGMCLQYFNSCILMQVHVSLNSYFKGLPTTKASTCIKVYL